MPLVDFNDPDIWAAWYVVPLADSETAGFERRVKDRIIGTDHLNLIEALALQEGTTILLVGGAYGWIAEELSERGITCTITDISTWIQSNKAENASLPILNESALTPESRANIKRAANLDTFEKFDFIITEDVLPCLDDTECLELCVALRLMGDTVVHWISSMARPPLNSKSVAAWKLLTTPDKVIKRGSRTAY